MKAQLNFVFILSFVNSVYFIICTSSDNNKSIGDLNTKNLSSQIEELYQENESKK